jgi:hypothetical protein
MLIQFRMFLQMCLELTDLSVVLLAGLDGASQSFPVDLSGVVVLSFYFEDVHQYHVLFFLFHIL